VDEQIRRDQEQEPTELSPDELEAEEVAELPDREALSLISPDGMGSFTTLDGVSPQRPPDLGYDTIQPMPPDRLS
jgi:hypothetical protein